MEAKVISCNCVSEYQDKLYGPKRRVHNPMVKDRRLVAWTCTVCSNKVNPSKGDQLSEKENK